jgi:WD40 repeat protein
MKHYQFSDVKILNRQIDLCDTLVGLLSQMRVVNEYKHFATASVDGAIKVWDIKTEECIQILYTDSPCTIFDVIQLKDGRLLSGDEKGSIDIWDIVTGKNLGTWKGHTDAIRRIIQIQDGTVISAGRDGHTIRLWNPQTGTCVRVFKKHTGYVVSLLEYNENTVISGGNRDCAIHVWNPHTCEFQFSLIGHSKEVDTLVKLQNGMIASGSWDSTIIIWDLTNRCSIRTLTKHNAYIRSIKQLFNGTLVSGGDDRKIMLWDTHHDFKPRTITTNLNDMSINAVNSVAEIKNDLFITGGDGGECYLWNSITGKCITAYGSNNSRIWSVIPIYLKN